VHVIEVRDGDLLDGIARQAKALGITDAAIVTLIGAVDRFTVSTMPKDDPSSDVVTEYDSPAEMTATGEIVAGVVHIHAVMAVEGDHAVAGHLHSARVGAWVARAYVMPVA
jgi:uncharacterized protein